MALDLILLLGGNLGDRQACLSAAVAGIAGLPGFQVRAVSRVYETEPVDVRPEHADRAYLNAALRADCERPLPAAAAALAALENRLGRVRDPADRNAPRTMDIDIIAAGALCGNFDGIVVPHPRWAQRRFVVAPLADLIPEAILPGQTRSVRAILADLPDRPAVRVCDWTLPAGDAA